MRLIKGSLGQMSLLSLLAFTGLLSAGEDVWQKGDPWPCKKPTILKSSVSATISWEHDQYSYRYRITNSPQSERPIRIFEVDLRDNPSAGVLSLRNYRNLEDFRDRDRKLYEVPRVHVLLKASPAEWVGEGDSGEWGADPYGGLRPGLSEEGFSFYAKEPPGIREYALDADDNEWDFFLQKLYRESPAKAAFYQNSKEFMIEANTPLENIGKTVVPVKPIEPIVVSSWTIRMTEDAIEARKQKWIKTDRNLVEIKKLIVTLNTTNIMRLRAATKNIEAYVLAERKSGNLTDEADALIRLNAHYLLWRLEKK